MNDDDSARRRVRGIHIQKGLQVNAIIAHKNINSSDATIVWVTPSTPSSWVSIILSRPPACLLPKPLFRRDTLSPSSRKLLALARQLDQASTYNPGGTPPQSWKGESIPVVAIAGIAGVRA